MFTPFENRVKKGFTLVEVLVGATLGFLILGIVSQLLVSSMRVSEKGGQRVERDQKALLLGERLSRDLRTTTKNGIAIHRGASRLKLTIHPRKLETATIVWEPHLIYYHWENEHLPVTKLALPSTPTAALAPSLPQVLGLSPLPDGSDLEFGEILDFSVRLLPDGLVTFEAEIGKPGQSTVVRRTVLLRNGL